MTLNQCVLVLQDRLLVRVRALLDLPDCPVPAEYRAEAGTHAMISAAATWAHFHGWPVERVADLFDEAARQLRSGEARTAGESLLRSIKSTPPGERPS
jgi:RecB family exonuclease